MIEGLAGGGDGADFVAFEQAEEFLLDQADALAQAVFAAFGFEGAAEVVGEVDQGLEDGALAALDAVADILRAAALEVFVVGLGALPGGEALGGFGAQLLDFGGVGLRLGRFGRARVVGRRLVAQRFVVGRADHAAPPYTVSIISCSSALWKRAAATERE